MPNDTLIPLRNVALQSPPPKKKSPAPVPVPASDYLSSYLQVHLAVLHTRPWTGSGNATRVPSCDRVGAPQVKRNIYFRNIFKLKYGDQKIMGVLELGRFIVTNSIFFYVIPSSPLKMISS